MNGRLASILVDIGLRNTAPDAARQWLLWAWVYFKQPRPDGLSSDDEFATLCSIEDKLTPLVQEKCRAIPVGRITTDGRREFYFYGPSIGAFEGVVREAMSPFTGYEFDQGGRHDPQWQQYLNVLYPSPDDLQRILNREVLDVMAKEGDEPQTPREVLHWSYFPKEDNRLDFKAAVQAKGYRIDSERHHSESDNPYGICFGKVQKTSTEAIDESVLELAKLSERFHGAYDGWEAQVMSDEVAEKPGAKPN